MLTGIVGSTCARASQLLHDHCSCEPRCNSARALNCGIVNIYLDGVRAFEHSDLLPRGDLDEPSMVSAFCPPRLCFSMRIPTNRAHHEPRFNHGHPEDGLRFATPSASELSRAVLEPISLRGYSRGRRSAT